MIFFFAYLQLQLPIKKKKKCPHDDKNVKKRTLSHVIGKTVNWNKTPFLRGGISRRKDVGSFLEGMMLGMGLQVYLNW